MAQSGQEVDNGEKTTPITSLLPECNFSWTIDNPNIGLPASGYGPIGPFVAINNGTTPIIATLKATSLPKTYAYVANANNASITVVDVENDSIVKLIPAATNPWELVKNSDGSLIYATLQSSLELAIINTTTNTTQKKIKLSYMPQGIAITPDDSKLYIACASDEKVICINTGDFSTTEIQVEDDPFYLQIHPNGKYVYVANSNSKSISVISTATNEVITTIRLNNYAYSIGISPDGNTLYCTDNTTNQIAVISTVSNSQTGTIDNISYPIGATVHPNGKFLYVANALSNTISVISMANNSLVTTIPVDLTPIYVKLNRDGSRLFVGTLGKTENIFVINTETNTVEKRINGGIEGYAIETIDKAPCGNVPIIYTITVNATPPAIIQANGTLPAFTTTYGRPSAASSFTVSGVSLKAGITITPPAGFEVSADNISFSNTITVGKAGKVNATPVYVRLSGKSPVNIYTGDVTISSTGTTAIKKPISLGTVNPAPLQITADDKSKTEGAANPILTASYNGFVNNETASVLTTAPVMSTNADEFSLEGQYPITIGGAAAANYTISYQDGTLTVKPPVKELIIPNAFSPNGDGINDVWIIKNLETYTNATVEVYNRAGIKLYTTTNAPWDGYHKGKPVPAGTYYYVITIKDKFKILSGYVALLR